MTTPTPNPEAGPICISLCCYSLMQSTHRHHLRDCFCGKSFVDGGSAYLRKGAETLDSFPRTLTPEELKLLSIPPNLYKPNGYTPKDQSPPVPTTPHKRTRPPRRNPPGGQPSPA